MDENIANPEAPIEELEPIIDFREFAERMRASGLDALRGISIFLMALSGYIPYGILPDWMYHAQLPPPDHQFQAHLPGLTWVDLVFPFFLFSMGVAIPLAMGHRLDRGENRWKILWETTWRGLLLAGFAIFNQNTRPPILSQPTIVEWLMGIAGFLFVIPVLVKLPKSWSRTTHAIIRSLGWMILLAYCFTVKSRDGSGWSWSKNDIILLVLANCAFFGGIFYWLTRHSPKARWILSGIILGIFLSRDVEGWTKSIWQWTPLSEVYRFGFLKYLMLILPATIVGEKLLEFINAPRTNHPTSETLPVKTRLLIVTGLVCAIFFVTLVGMQERMVWQSGLINLVLGFFVILSLQGTDKVLGGFFRYVGELGVGLLLMGFAFEPLEGGIKKDFTTVSYFLTTFGLACLLLMILSYWLDWREKRWASLFVANGQNPILAYLAITHLIPAIWALSQAKRFIEPLTMSPWLGFGRGLLETSLLLVVIAWLSKLKLFCRA